MKKILIFCPHFPPAFKGGGPIQSLLNLVGLLKKDFEIFVFCSATDLGEIRPMNTVILDQWSEFTEGVKVFYAHSSVLKSARNVLITYKPDIVYINGIFSFSYNFFPLWLTKNENSKHKIIIAPRGMLQLGALSIKPIKKRVFLYLFRCLSLHENIFWHATDEQEKNDVKGIFGLNADVNIALNIPKSPVRFTIPRLKKSGQLKMIYLSLITKKKNLHLVLQSLNSIQTSVQFDIYGPIKDKVYWQECEKLIQNDVHKIRYLGSILPNSVQAKLAEYEAMILPTMGENFGHSIYESLSVGTPVILSAYTPWGVLQDKQAGVTVMSFNKIEWINAIQNFIDLNQVEHSRLSVGAHNLAMGYFSKNDFLQQYMKIFC